MDSRASTTALDSLAPEIVLRILELATPAVDVVGCLPSSVPWSYMAVSRTWQALIVSTPFFWANLAFIFPGMPEVQRTSAAWARRINLCFARAVPLKPSVTFEGPWAPEWLNPLVCLKQHLSAVSSFQETSTVKIHTLCMFDASLPPKRPLDLAELQRLWMKGGHSRTPRAYGGSLPDNRLVGRLKILNPPKLAALTLQHYALKLPALTAEPEVRSVFARLHALALIDCSFTLDPELATVLRHLPRIESLHIAWTVDMGGRSFSTSLAYGQAAGQQYMISAGYQSFCLPKLRSLTLALQDRTCAVLRLFTAPSLTRLSVRLAGPVLGQTEHTEVEEPVNAILRFIEGSNINTTLQEIELRPPYTHPDDDSYRLAPFKSTMLPCVKKATLTFPKSQTIHDMADTFADLEELTITELDLVDERETHGELVELIKTRGLRRVNLVYHKNRNITTKLLDNLQDVPRLEVYRREVDHVSELYLL